MSPFLPRNKILVNEDNDDNPETTDTSLYGKDDMSHTSPDHFTKKNEKKLQIMMTNKKRKLRKFKKVMKVLIILKLRILCVMIILLGHPKKEKH